MPSASPHESSFEAAEAEARLRTELALQRARVTALERELEALRSSESYRIGHALVEGLDRRLRRRPSALLRALYHRLSGRTRGHGFTAAFGHGQEPVTSNKSVLIVAWGVGDQRIREYVERVQRLQVMLVDFHPLFLVDSITIEPIQRRGIPFEYIIPLDEWSQQRPAHEWGAYVTGRVAALCGQHRPRTVVVLDADGPRNALDQGVINTVVLPAIGASEDNLLEG